MFRFKQFAVRQDRCPMKVGTDGVLLGAWAEVRPGDRRMLDVGTGTGLIALMLAQRSAARITAVDVDAECATQAAENFAASPWADGGLFYAPARGAAYPCGVLHDARTAAGTFAARDRTRRLGLLYGGLPPSDGGFLP